MKTIITIAAVLILIWGCNEKNEPGFDTKPLNEQLLGRWRLVSETRTGSYENSRYKGLPLDFIEYRADGRAYSEIQGQFGFSYNQQVNNSAKTLRFYFLCTHSYYLSTYPCLTPPDCAKTANVQFISDDLLVVSQSFRDTSNGVVASLTIVDSLVR
ncbi:MAG: hypothetical protein ACK5OP_16065 [Sphingobacteriales bacterium]|jgi:hypothetical protein